ncbi:MAG: polyphosphate polymerase domain-containing protein [Gemmatimonadales bacterium]
MNRFEVKYLVAAARGAELLAEVGDYLVPDRHSDGEAGYRIGSIYWDTPGLLFFWEKVEGVKYRRKLRFRRYQGSDSVFVEIKQREDRTLQKRRLKWPMERVEAVFGSGRQSVDWAGLDDDPVATEVALMIERLRLRPTVGVTYRRRAYQGRFDPRLRISFDTRLLYRPAPVGLADMFDGGRYIVDPRIGVLEIKYDHQVPSWLTKLVCRHGLTMVRMSKYCSAVDRHRFGGQNT